MRKAREVRVKTFTLRSPCGKEKTSTIRARNGLQSFVCKFRLSPPPPIRSVHIPEIALEGRARDVPSENNCGEGRARFPYCRGDDDDGGVEDG